MKANTERTKIIELEKELFNLKQIIDKVAGDTHWEDFTEEQGDKVLELQYRIQEIKEEIAFATGEWELTETPDGNFAIVMFEKEYKLFN